MKFFRDHVQKALYTLFICVGSGNATPIVGNFRSFGRVYGAVSLPLLGGRQPCVVASEHFCSLACIFGVVNLALAVMMTKFGYIL